MQLASFEFRVAELRNPWYRVQRLNKPRIDLLVYSYGKNRDVVEVGGRKMGRCEIPGRRRRKKGTRRTKGLFLGTKDWKFN